MPRRPPTPLDSILARLRAGDSLTAIAADVGPPATVPALSVIAALAGIPLQRGRPIGVVESRPRAPRARPPSTTPD